MKGVTYYGKINSINLSAQQSIGQGAEASSNERTIDVFPGKVQSPEERQKNEQKAIQLLQNAGYNIKPDGDGQYILEDALGHKSKISNVGLNDKGEPNFCILTVQIIDPSQKERFHRRVLNRQEDTPEEKAKYAKQAMDIAKKAGYKIESKSDGTYILTKPDGSKSLVNNFDIDYDGGATWTILPVYLGGDNNTNLVFES